MKSVLISIQPRWCELIASGKKTVEVRKTKPKLEPPFKCYIYCTKKKKQDEYGPIIFYKDPTGICVDNGEGCSPLLTGMVIGEFVCNCCEAFTTNYYTMDRPQTLRIARTACLGLYELTEYENNALCLYGWHISDLVIYDDPKPLSEFYMWKKCNSCKTSGYESSACIYDEDCKVPTIITRPPQSWCYVEEATGNA